jgi:signal transduction histidine kinase
LQGQHFSLLMEEPEFELMGRLFGERRASERAADRVTLHLVDREGRRREFEVSATGRYDEANRFLGTQGVACDVTEQSRLEQEIAHERSKFRSVFDAVGIGLSINGLDLRVREANQCQRELYQGRQIEGQHCYRVYFGQNQPCAWCGLAQAVKTGQTVVRENVFNPKNGRIYHLTFSPLREENQRLSRVIEVMTDVTDLHNVGQQMARTEKLQALGRLAGGVTNRLNNALSMILGRAQMLQPRAVEEDLRRGLETIIRATEEAARTVHQIQRFALTPRSDEAFQAVDLNEVVCDALHATEARWRDQAQLESVAIDVRTILAEPDLLVQGQHNELVEAFTNLIINAVEAMPLGGTLTLETRREDDRASVSVSDTGEGMEEEVQQHIFDPFFTTKGVGASGMGLSVSRSIFERHGADIWVDSEVGRGTTFHIEFAAVEGERPVEETPALGRAVGARRILIAEDEEHLRELLRDILITEGHEVVMCADGVSALEEFARQPCDFVFTDLSMPGRSGWDVVREVKAQRPGVPVVIITGWGASIDQTVIAEAGADAIIAKPYNVTEILQLVNTLGAERDT